MKCKFHLIDIKLKYILILLIANKIKNFSNHNGSKEIPILLSEKHFNSNYVISIK